MDTRLGGGGYSHDALLFTQIEHGWPPERAESKRIEYGQRQGGREGSVGRDVWTPS